MTPLFERRTPFPRGARLPAAPGALVHKAVVLLLVSLLVPVGASAQPASSTAKNPTAPGGLFTPPPVTDPLLDPVLPPRAVLASWAEAVARVRSASSMRIAMDQVLRAEGISRSALARYLPSLSATGRYTHQFLRNTGLAPIAVTTPTGDLTLSTSAPLANAFDVTVRAQQSILDVAALDQIGIASLGEHVSRLSAEEEKRALIVGMADEIVAVVAAERSAEINRAGLRMALEQLALVNRRRDLGGATTIDEVRAEEYVERARATLVQGDDALRQTRGALGLALGGAEETGVAPSLDMNGIVDDASASCRRVQTLEERADIAAARATVEVAKRNLQNIWLTFLPTVTAQSAINETSTVPVGYPNPVWSVSGLLSVPIWDGGARYGYMKTARADQDIAEEALDRLRRQTVLEIDFAQRELLVAQTADALARRERDLSAREEELTLVSFNGGAATSLELVAASETHRQAELGLAMRDSELVQARLRAAMALATCPL
jgi:outer membrane protein TolC